MQLIAESRLVTLAVGKLVMNSERIRKFDLKTAASDGRPPLGGPG